MADEQQYYLTKQDVDLLRDLYQAKQNGWLSTRQRPNVPEEQGNAPEVYIALVPTGGITGRNGLVCSYADCTVYRLLKAPDGTDTLTSAGAGTRRVYNRSTSPVGSGTYPEIKRDKYGTWWTHPDSVGATCLPALILETDVKCESSGTGTGARSHLNLYHRPVFLRTDSSGCVIREEGAEYFVRIIGCCDPSCTPDHGTGTHRLCWPCVTSDPIDGTSPAPYGTTLCVTFSESGASTVFNGLQVEITWDNESGCGLSSFSPFYCGRTPFPDCSLATEEYCLQVDLTCGFDGKVYLVLSCYSGTTQINAIAGAVPTCSPSFGATFTFNSHSIGDFPGLTCVPGAATPGYTLTAVVTHGECSGGGSCATPVSEEDRGFSAGCTSITPPNSAGIIVPAGYTLLVNTTAYDASLDPGYTSITYNGHAMTKDVSQNSTVGHVQAAIYRYYNNTGSSQTGTITCTFKGSTSLGTIANVVVIQLTNHIKSSDYFTFTNSIGLMTLPSCSYCQVNMAANADLSATTWDSPYTIGNTPKCLGTPALGCSEAFHINNTGSTIVESATVNGLPGGSEHVGVAAVYT